MEMWIEPMQEHKLKCDSDAVNKEAKNDLYTIPADTHSAQMLLLISA